MWLVIGFVRHVSSVTMGPFHIIAIKTFPDISNVGLADVWKTYFDIASLFGFSPFRVVLCKNAVWQDTYQIKKFLIQKIYTLLVSLLLVRVSTLEIQHSISGIFNMGILTYFNTVMQFTFLLMFLLTFKQTWRNQKELLAIINFIGTSRNDLPLLSKGVTTKIKFLFFAHFAFICLGNPFLEEYIFYRRIQGHYWRWLCTLGNNLFYFESHFAIKNFTGEESATFFSTSGAVIGLLGVLLKYL